MKKLKIAPLVIAVALLAARSSAQVIAVPAAAPDSRLDQKVTLKATFAKLADVLDQLSKQSGVYLHAGTGAQDWKVREQRMTIDAKDAPLRAVIDSIAAVHRFRVSTGKRDGKTSYLFWQDRNQRDLESALLATQTEQAAQRQVATRQAALDSADAALKLTPEQAQQAKLTDPWLGFLGGTTTGRSCAEALSLLNQDQSGFRDLMLRGKNARLDLSAASPELLRAVGEALQGWSHAFAGKQEASFLQNLTPTALVASPMQGGQASEYGMGGMLMILALPKSGVAKSDMQGFSDGVPVGFIPLANSGSVMGSVFGKMFTAIDSGKPIAEAVGGIQEISRRIQKRWRKCWRIPALWKRKLPPIRLCCARLIGSMSQSTSWPPINTVAKLRRRLLLI